jgi:sulfur-carrier protein
VTVRFWAGARRAAGHAQETMTAADVGSARKALATRPALAALMEVATILMDGGQTTDETVLTSGAVLDVLPPVAGG